MHPIARPDKINKMYLRDLFICLVNLRGTWRRCLNAGYYNNGLLYLNGVNGACAFAAAEAVAFGFIRNFAFAAGLVHIKYSLGAEVRACLAADAQGFIDKHGFIHCGVLSAKYIYL
jgi:hypothetical protein